MKHFYLLMLIFTCFYVKINSQGLTEVWQKTYGGSYPEYSVLIDTSAIKNNLILWGHSESIDGDLPSTTMSKDIWMLEVDENGNIENSNIYGETAEDFFSSAKETSNNSFLVSSTNMDKNDFIIRSINYDKEVNWIKSYGGSQNEIPSKIIKTKDNNYLVVGNTFSNDGDVNVNHGYEDIWILKINNEGDTIWTKSIGGSQWDICYDGICLDDSSFILIGTTLSNDGDFYRNQGGTDMFILKLSNQGEIEWVKCYGGSEQDYGNSIIHTSNDEFIVVGRSSSNNGDVVENRGKDDGWIIKINNKGNLIWSFTTGGTDDEDLVQIISYNRGEFLIGGYTRSNDGDVSANHGGIDQWLLLINDSGEIIWSNCYGGSNDDIVTSLLEKNNNYYVFGYSDSNDGDIQSNKGYYDFCLVKFKPLPILNIISSNNFICKGDSVSLTTKLNANIDSVKYYWIKDGNILLNERDSVFIIKSVDTTNIGHYNCIIESNTKRDTSNTITISFGKNYIYNNIGLCQGDSVFLKGHYQNTTGLYYDTIRSIIGCDSVIITQLTVYPKIEFNITENLCVGDSFRINNKYIKISGEYLDSLLTNYGCDSIIIHNVTFDDCHSNIDKINNDVNIYPNPARDDLFIDLAKIKYYELYDPFGVLLLKSNAPMINVRNYVPGLYIIKIVDFDNIELKKKIIIIK